MIKQNNKTGKWFIVKAEGEQDKARTFNSANVLNIVENTAKDFKTLATHLINTGRVDFSINNNDYYTARIVLYATMETMLSRIAMTPLMLEDAKILQSS